MLFYSATVKSRVLYLLHPRSPNALANRESSAVPHARDGHRGLPCLAIRLAPQSLWRKAQVSGAIVTCRPVDLLQGCRRYARE